MEEENHQKTVRTRLPSYTVHGRFYAPLFRVCATEFYRALVALEYCQQCLNQPTWFTWTVRDLSINFLSIDKIILSLADLICLQSKEEGRERNYFHWLLIQPIPFWTKFSVLFSAQRRHLVFVMADRDFHMLEVWTSREKWPIFCETSQPVTVGLIPVESPPKGKKPVRFDSFRLRGWRSMSVSTTGWFVTKYCVITRRGENYRWDKETRKILWTASWGYRLSHLCFSLLSLFLSFESTYKRMPFETTRWNIRHSLYSDYLF